MADYHQDLRAASATTSNRILARKLASLVWLPCRGFPHIILRARSTNPWVYHRTVIYYADGWNMSSTCCERRNCLCPKLHWRQVFLTRATSHATSID